MVGGAALRTILGDGLGVEARVVRLTYGPHGKPELAAPREWNALRRLPAAQRHAALFDGSTRKEADLKALGEGAARLEHLEASPAETGRWWLESLVPEPGYVAAVAVEGHLTP